MRRVLRSTVSDLGFGCRRPAYWLVAAVALSGCGHEGKVDVKSVTEPPTVRLVLPLVRKIVRVVGQPSFIEAYERTSIYPKSIKRCLLGRSPGASGRGRAASRARAGSGTARRGRVSVRRASFTHLATLAKVVGPPRGGAVW